MVKGWNSNQKEIRENFQKHIDTLPHPYNQIKCTTKSKILGHMMTADNNFTIAVLDRLNKAKGAWAKLRRSFLTNTVISIKYRLIISHSIIGSILLYGLHIFNLNNTNYSLMQSFYSKCIREITNGIKKFDPNQNRKTNKQIRIGNNISTIQSRLRYANKHFLHLETNLIHLLSKQ